jgi:hypothetical protein
VGKDIPMHVATGHAYHEGVKALLVTDKRGQRLKPAQREGEWLPIGELGSKAIYQVSAERFVAVIPYK